MIARYNNVFRQFVISLLCLLASYCVVVPNSHAATIPEFYGVYALDKGRLTELAGGSNNIEKEFSPQVQFIVFDKNVSYIANNISLKSMIYIRNNIHEGVDLNGQRLGTVAVNTWRSQGSADSITFRSKPVKGENEMVYLVPRSELKPGAYQLNARGKAAEYFFINKNSVTNNLYESELCVDVLKPQGFGTFLRQTSGSGFETIPCSKSSGIATNASSPKKESRSSGSPVPTDGSSPKQGQPNRQELPEFKREYMSSLEQTWVSALRVLEEQKDSIETENKSGGIITTNLARHGGFLSAYYAKYDIRIAEKAGNKSEVTFKAERYTRDMNCQGCMRSVKLIPDNSKLRDKRLKTIADEFFSQLEEKL